MTKFNLYERIRPDHVLKNSSKNEILKVNKEKLKVTNYWQNVPENSLVSVLYAKIIKKLSMFLKRNSAVTSCSLSNLVVYSITSAGLKLPNWKNPIAPRSLTVTGYQGEIFKVEFHLSKGRLCVLVTPERQQNKPDLLIAFLKPFSQCTKKQTITSLFQSENEVSPRFEHNYNFPKR